jgi:hypothetical protein
VFGLCQRDREKNNLGIFSIGVSIFERIDRYPNRAPFSERKIQMRFMVLMKANADSEAGKMPSSELLTAMGKFNEELMASGVLVGGEGLAPSSQGARVKFAPGAKPVAYDGPFAETKELLAGFWMLNVKSKQEAIDWVSRIPNPDNLEYEVEIRKVFETADFDQEHPAIQREHEMRAELEAKNAGH